MYSEELIINASKIAKCENCKSFYDCDTFYDEKNIIKCAINKLVKEL